MYVNFDRTCSKACHMNHRVCADVMALAEVHKQPATSKNRTAVNETPVHALLVSDLLARTKRFLGMQLLGPTKSCRCDLSAA